MDNRRSRPFFWRGYLAGVATLVLFGVLWHGISQPAPAHAQIPDSGAQRDQMIKKLTTANAKLSEVVGLLKQIRDNTKPDAAEEKTQEK